jgi:DNA invertase Pin-like site-specific DNA recombinase
MVERRREEMAQEVKKQPGRPGRPRKMDAERIKEAQFLREAGHTHRDIAMKFGVSITTLFKALSGVGAYIKRD